MDETHQNQIIFAISVHSIECWLLPLYYADKKKSKIKSCLSTLNEALQKQEKFTIDAKNPEYYERVSGKYRKHKVLMKCYPDNPSFKIFIAEVANRNIVILDYQVFFNRLIYKHLLNYLEKCH